MSNRIFYIAFGGYCMELERDKPYIRFRRSPYRFWALKVFFQVRELIPDKLRVEVADLVKSQWWVQCLLQTEHDNLGMILRAVMAKPTISPPWFGPSAIIDQHGIVLSNYVDERNKAHVGVVVCHINDLVSNLRRLCDTLGLSDVHAHALFGQVRGWIKEDARPTTEQAEDRIPIEWRTVQ